jgi:hypothetical protein
MHKQELAGQYVQKRKIKCNVINMDSFGDRAGLTNMLTSHHNLHHWQTQ